jgi:hypothetical protein
MTDNRDTSMILTIVCYYYPSEIGCISICRIAAILHYEVLLVTENLLTLSHSQGCFSWFWDAYYAVLLGNIYQSYFPTPS